MLSRSSRAERGRLRRILTAWLADLANSNNRNKQNKLSASAAGTFFLEFVLPPFHVQNHLLGKKYPRNGKAPKTGKNNQIFGVWIFGVFFCCCKFISQQDAMSRIERSETAVRRRVASLTVSGDVDYTASSTKKLFVLSRT